MVVIVDLQRERALIERARSSPEAFGELYDTYYNQIFGYALKRTADIEVARDVTSSVFFKALKNIKNYRWQGIAFSHWLYRIANREVVDYYTKTKHETNHRHDSSMEIESQASREELLLAGSELKRHDDYLDLHHYVSRLPAKYQEVISLKYFEDMDIKQIAGILHKPEGTVKSLLHRSIEHLRRMME